MKRLFLIMVLIGTALSIYGQTKEEDILKFLELSNSENLSVQIFNALMPQMKALAPEVPEAFWELMMEKLDMNGLIHAYIPVYDKYYTHDEIKELIRFYESPLGRKMVEITPQMMEETMLIGQKWGEKLGLEIIMELIKSGYFNPSGDA